MDRTHSCADLALKSKSLSAQCALCSALQGLSVMTGSRRIVHPWAVVCVKPAESPARNDGGPVVVELQ